MKQRIIISVFLLALPFCLCAQQRNVISLYGDNFIGVGPSVRSGEVDLKYQWSVKVYPVELRSGWEFFFAYTQTTVWDITRKSGPFHDNTYRPGFYLEKRPDNVNSFTLGIEHRSNGRPYFGNAVASAEMTEDYSRGMNYLTAGWDRAVGGGWSLVFNARAGVGCGVGEYPRHEALFTQDLFLYYIGYADAGLRYDNGRLAAKALVTPLWNKSLCNVTADIAYRFHPDWPQLFAQFHYGYDECLCDCLPGCPPPANIRFGVKL